MSDYRKGWHSPLLRDVRPFSREVPADPMELFFQIQAALSVSWMVPVEVPGGDDMVPLGDGHHINYPTW